MVRYTVLRNLYELEKTIGCGGFAKVKLATHVLTGEKVAIKIMEKSALGEDLPRVRVELDALRALSHEHISQLYQVLETETNFFIVMEYCAGGELFDHIVQKNRLNEREARAAFRQIVSAVAYLHSKGFVHRDLKPENVLLDKDQNMKLIDFGLCAKPAGGLTNYLYTSCGSPTYAAPELVQGNKYLGTEADVWSMGVLLYALLCGFLPFDDEKIDVLYKKILSGKYEEPNWLSSESRALIKHMLQVDTRKRISLKQLMTHPWVMQGYRDPITAEDGHMTRERDSQCLNVLAQHKGITTEEMWGQLKQRRFDYDTATYLLLLSRKRRGLPLRLLSVWASRRLRYQYTRADSEDRGTPKAVVPVKRTRPLDCTPVAPKRERVSPEKENRTILTINKRLRSPGRDDSSATSSRAKRAATVHGEDDFYEPLAASPGRSRAVAEPEPAPPAIIVTASNERYVSDPHAGEQVVEKLGDQFGEQGVSGSTGTPTPKSARRLLGSLERSLHRVRHILTPRRRLGGGESTPSSSQNTPTLLPAKGLCNVSTASSNNPDHVLKELQSALDSKGISCRQKGFTLRGKVEGASGGQLSFELEVCLISTAQAPIVGIRRKRLKGDAWCYKRVCEEVLAQAAV